MTQIQEEILELKRQKNAVILAHYYQEPQIQEIADFVGDSLGLSQQAAATEADIIVFAGVHFMAETASILNPDKVVLLPEPEASCSLAISCPPEAFKAFIDKHPDHKVVTYVNCSADIKAMSDVICTSSNALSIINSFPKDEKIICAPDNNLGKYLMQETGRELVLWDGVCDVHEAFALDKINYILEANPEACFIAHPESNPKVLEIAEFIGSTTALLNYVKNSPKETFVVATEAGILYKMQQAVPNKKLIPAPIDENNTCACSECKYMKMNTLQKVLGCLVKEGPVVSVENEIRSKALIPLQRMLDHAQN